MSRNRKIMLCLIVVGALITGGVALADKPPKPDTDCKWKNLVCPPDWDPVYCDGVLYNNRCLAKKACARHCRKFPSA